MTRDDIIRMAREAGLCHWGALTLVKGNVKAEIGNGPETLHPCLDAFFDAVCQASAAAEREACLSILRDMEGQRWHIAMHGGEMKGVSLTDAYTAIRARGQE